MLAPRIQGAAGGEPPRTKTGSLFEAGTNPVLEGLVSAENVADCRFLPGVTEQANAVANISRPAVRFLVSFHALPTLKTSY